MRSLASGVILLAALAVLAACDSTGPKSGPPTAIRKGTLPSGLTVGQVVDSVVITINDADDRPVEGAAVSWSTTDGSVTPATTTTDPKGVASATWTLGTIAGQQSLTATVGELEATFRPYVNAGPLTAVILDVGNTTLTALGDTLRIHASTLDAYDNAVTPPALTWTSSAPDVASVSHGVVVARGNGSARIIASYDTFADTASVTVAQVITALALDPSAPVMVPAESVLIRAMAVDARGNAVDTAMAPVWSSSDESVATVDLGGTVRALAVGTAVITAAAGEFSARATTRVKTGPRPTISSVAPAVLGAGDTATITGTGFSTDLALDSVTVGGMAATVQSATGTELVAIMPGAGAFPCGPQTDMDVVVSIDGLTATVSHPVAGAARHDLAVGQSMAFQGSAAGCNEFTEPGHYVLAVFNASPSLSTVTGFQLEGTADPSSTALDLALAPTAMSPAATSTRRYFTVDPTSPPLPVDTEATGHLRMLEANAAVARRLGAPLRSPPAARAPVGTTAAATAAAPEVGDLRTFRIPDIDASSDQLCTDYSEVTARVAYSGTKGVIWEDTTAPLAGRMDTAWARLGQEFDEVMYPVLLQYFGDPLAYDSHLDDNGRFFMLFSKKVNDFTSGVAGFVFSGDFFPRVQCQSSDDAEIFYGRVPTDSVEGYGDDAHPYPILAWRWSMRSTVIHEVKHITSYAHKLVAAAAGSVNWEEQWLEESTARLAEEYYARALFGFTQTSDVTYHESIWCERRVGENWPECDPYPSIMGKHFSGLNTYYRGIEDLSPLGSTEDGDWSFYGSGWLFVRWAIDQSGLDEATFVKALVDEPNLTGIDNIAARTGRSFRDLLADFSLAMAVDNHPSGFTPARSQLTLPGWNTRDIFSGLHDDYAGTTLESVYDLAWPLATHAITFGNFTVDVTGVRGGSTSVFDLTGTLAGGQLLRVLSPSGGNTPSNLGLAIVRVQ